MVVRIPPANEEMSEEQAEPDAKRRRKKSRTGYYNCLVNCLDGSIIKAEVGRSSRGEELFNKVISNLSISEKECVGLNFVNEKGVKVWLDIHKEMKHQIGESSDVVLNFRLKFYEPEPNRIKDVFLRYLFYLQVRDDLISGKLKCSENTYIILGSYAAQSELGDFNLHTHDHNYLSNYLFAPERAPEQTSDYEKRVHELHKEHRGLSPSQAEINFLEVAKKIPRYGVDVHNAKDNTGEVEIGVAAIGLYIYRFNRKEYLFRWQLVDAVLYNRKKYTVQLLEHVPKAGENHPEENSKKKPQLTFIYYFDSATKCKQCYKASVEYHTFFRLLRPDEPRKKADSLKLGSSFRYSDRTLYQLRNRSEDENPPTEVPFTRTPTKTKSITTPRESWNPDDEHLKDRDAGLLENGSHLPLVDEEPHSPVKKDGYYVDMDLDIPVHTYPKSVPVEESLLVANSCVDVESAPTLEEQKMIMEEVEIDEANPEDSWFDPSKWDVVERTMPDGTKKKYRVRLVKADRPESLYIKTLKPAPAIPSYLLPDEPVMQMKEIDLDEAHAEEFNPDEWQMAEVITPDGNTKKVRRTILITDVNVIPKKPSEINDVEPLGVLEERELDDVPCDEPYSEDSVFDPAEWQVVEKILPDGKTPVRCRVLVTKLQYVNKKPSDIPSDEPIAICEDAEINPFHPSEWEIVEKEVDGVLKPVHRRALVNHVEFVKRKRSEVGSNESAVAVQEIDIGDEDPKVCKYDPSKWELVETTLPDGKIKPVLRRIVITRYQVFNKKPSEVDPNEPLTEIEEVEIGEEQPDNEDYDPDEWEIEEVVQPDGSSKFVRRRLIITRVEYVYKKPSDVTIDEQPVAELEEVAVDEVDPNCGEFDSGEWEVVGKTTPDGRQIRVHQRYMIRRVHITYKKPSDVPPDHCKAKVQEIEIDEENPEDEKYDPNQWEIVEKTWQGCMGKVTRIRRRIIMTKAHVLSKKPSEVSHDDPLKKAIDDDVDPKEWEVAEIPLSDGEVKTGRCRYLVPHVSTEYKKPSEVPAGYPVAEVEEVELSSASVQDEKFNPDDWEVVEKQLPDGKMKPVYRRYKVPCHTKEYKKLCDVEPEVPIAVIEETQMKPIHIEDDKWEADGWETCSKMLPDGTTDEVQQRYLLVCRESTYKKPDEVADDVPYITMEESIIDEEKPDYDTYDPTEWDVVEKVTPNGENKRYRCRIKVTKVSKVHMKPSDVTDDRDYQNAQVEEVDMDEEHPEKIDLSEWDIIEKPLPNGTTKRVRRRFVVTRVEVVLKKPSELTADEPLGISVEEVPIRASKIEYAPKDWDVVEKRGPDGTKQRVCRRIIVKRIKPRKKADMPSIHLDLPVPTVDEEMVVPQIAVVDESIPDLQLPSSLQVDKSGGKKVMRRRSIKTKITPVGSSSVSVSTEEVPKQLEEIEINESDPQDEKYDSTEWETIEKILPDGTIKRFRRRIIETVVTTVNKRYDDTMVDGSPVCMEEFEIDDTHPENDKLDPSECEILEKTLPDGSSKRYSRRIISSTLPDSVMDSEPPELWEEIEVDESNPEDEKFTSDEWETFEKISHDGSKKRFRRRNLNVVTVHKKPIAITAGDVPLCVQDVEVDENLDQDVNLDDWEVVEKTLPDGRKKKVYRKILTTIFSSLNEKNEMIENPPIHIEEVEIYEASSDDEDIFNPAEWKVVDKVLPDGTVTQVRSRSSVTVITPKNTMKLEDKSVEETPVVAEEVEVDDTVHEQLDPEEWDVIERKLPDGSTKRFHRRIIRKYKKVPSHEHLDDAPVFEDHHPTEVKEIPMEEFEINPAELQMYNTPEWEIVERTMPDGAVKHFRRKIVTTVVTTVTTKTIVVHPDGTEEVVDEETTPGEETTLESIDGNLDTVTENFMKNLEPEEEPFVQPLVEENLEAEVDMSFDMDDILSEMDQISKSIYDTPNRNTECEERIHDAGVDEELEFASADFEIGVADDFENVRTASILKQKKLAKSEPHSSANVDPKMPSLDRRYIKGKPADFHDSEDTPRTYSAAKIEQKDVFHSHDDVNPEILYSLRDVSEVEQGQGGFVQAIKNRHDKIASEEICDMQQDCEYPDHGALHTKGHMPTEIVTYNVVTEPDDEIYESTECHVTTYTMPTEVITRTITCEGDPSTMSQEELQEIIRRAGSDDDILGIPNVSSVQRVVTGGDSMAGDDEELQKAINEAVNNTGNEGDGTFVFTVVKQYDEDGNMINTEVVGGSDTHENHFINDGTDI